MSTNYDGEAKRAQHQRALLHNAPKAAPREPKPGELLMTFERGQDVYRAHGGSCPTTSDNPPYQTLIGAASSGLE